MQLGVGAALCWALPSAVVLTDAAGGRMQVTRSVRAWLRGSCTEGRDGKQDSALAGGRGAEKEGVRKGGPQEKAGVAEEMDGARARNVRAICQC